MADHLNAHKLTIARRSVAQMTDGDLTELYAQGSQSFGPDAWAVLEQEFKARRLRLRPWPGGRVILTTAPYLDGYKVTEVLDIVSAEAVMGMNLILDFLSGIADAVGGRDKSTEGVLRDARDNCLQALRRQAEGLGADAVILRPRALRPQLSVKRRTPSSPAWWSGVCLPYCCRAACGPFSRALEVPLSLLYALSSDEPCSSAQRGIRGRQRQLSDDLACGHKLRRAHRPCRSPSVGHRLRYATATSLSRGAR
jgi:uncharacterized protein YbjQ (UPF0145 family)